MVKKSFVGWGKESRYDGGVLKPKLDAERQEVLRSMEDYEKLKKAKNAKGVKPLEVQPIGDNLILYRVEKEENVSTNGIILTGTPIQEPNRAVVVAVGLGKMTQDGTRLPMQVKVGDEIIFNLNGGTDIKHNGLDYKIISEKDVLFILNKKGE